MPESHSRALALSRRVLRLLIALNWVMGVGILGLFVASLVDGSWVAGALGVPTTNATLSLIRAMRSIMVIGLLGVPITNLALTRLLAIVTTVTVGDPFVAENATRLQKIAWAVLALQVLHLGVGLAVASISVTAAPLSMGWKFSPTPWLAILLLFVLARVFDHGTRMRDELEGTV